MLPALDLLQVQPVGTAARPLPPSSPQQRPASTFTPFKKLFFHLWDQIFLPIKNFFFFFFPPALPGFGPAKAREQFVFSCHCRPSTRWGHRRARICRGPWASGDLRGFAWPGRSRFLISLVNQWFAFGN